MIEPGHDGSFSRGGPGAVFSVEALVKDDHMAELRLEHRDHDHEAWTRRHTLPLPQSGRYAIAVDGLKERLRFMLSTDGPPGGPARVTIEEPDWRPEPANEDEQGREAERKE